MSDSKVIIPVEQQDIEFHGDVMMSVELSQRTSEVAEVGAKNE